MLDSNRPIAADGDSCYRKLAIEPIAAIAARQRSYRPSGRLSRRVSAAIALDSRAVETAQLLSVAGVVDDSAAVVDYLSINWACHLVVSSLLHAPRGVQHCFGSPLGSALVHNSDQHRNSCSAGT